MTRDYGARDVSPPAEEAVTESDTVMRVLERNADVSTRYGGRFVQSIEGLEADEAGPSDWFFYVDGVESTVGAADYDLHGGESIWWDYRDWSAAMRVPAVVGSWPQPFSGGYEGGSHPTAVECMGAAAPCSLVRSRLEDAGVKPAAGSPDGAIRILVGPWARVRSDPAAAQIEKGPESSGVFAEFRRRGQGFSLEGLDERGRPARAFGPETGLIAATRRYEAPPVWVVTGAGPAAVAAAARELDGAALEDHYAIAAESGRATPLPVR